MMKISLIAVALILVVGCASPPVRCDRRLERINAPEEARRVPNALENAPGNAAGQPAENAPGNAPGNAPATTPRKAVR